MAARRQDPVAREPLAVWGMFGVVAAAIFATYSRDPLHELYHVSGTGPGAGAGRVLVFLNFSTALAALPVLAFATTRALWQVGAVAAVLSAGVFWPGIVDQADIDARWANVIPAVGVLLALGLTLWRATHAGISPPARHRGDRWRLASGIVIVILALPWAAAELGLSFGDMSASWAPLGQARLHHAVHHGHHHGMDGTLLVLTALLLSRPLAQLTGRLRTTVALYLGVLAAYGLGNILNDAWYEQLVKRGWVSFSMPGVLQPALNLAWLLILVVGLLLGGLFLRAADAGVPARGRLPRWAVAAPAAAVVALVVLGAVQDPQPTAQTPFARTGAGTIVFPMAPSGHFHLYEIGADGRGLRQLTDEDASDLAPTFSRDGALAFQRNRDGGPHVFVLEPNGKARKVTDTGREGEPAWSPDGRRIAFVRNGSLYVIGDRGGPAHKVVSDASWPTWGPRSTLAYELQFAGSEVIAKSGEHVAVTAAVHEQKPAWSPDGRLIAFECRHGHHWHICIARPNLQLVRVLTTGADAFAPAWSPDGRRIAFIGDRDGNDQLYVMNADGSGIVRLTTGQADKEAPAWRP